MKWAMGVILAVAGGAVLLAFLTLDAASAGVFAFATGVVVVLGAAPVVFGALSRRGKGGVREGPAPTVVGPGLDAVPPAQPPRPERDTGSGIPRLRRRGHRRTRW